MGDCFLLADNFNRADNTNLGSSWEEVAGDSDIYQNTLRVPASGIAITTVTGQTINTAVSVLIPGLFSTPAVQNGEIYRLILNYFDTDNYLIGEYEANTDTSLATIRVIERSGGVETVLDTDTLAIAADAHTFTLCRTRDGLYAEDSGNPEVHAWDCLALSGENGTKAGVANWSPADPIQFDDFEFWNHDASDPLCPACPCDCEGYCVQPSLLLTMTASGGCSHLNGLTINLERLPPGNAEHIWRGQANLAGLWSSCGTIAWDLLLTCETNPACDLLSGKFVLGDQTGSCGPSACDDTAWFEADIAQFGPTEATCPVSISCDPLVIEYGPFSCVENPEIPTEECSLSFTITEP